MKKILLCCCGMLLALGSMAQPEEEPRGTDFTPGVIPTLRPNVKGDFQLPIPLANRSFSRTVNGIADAGLSVQFPFLRNFYAGAGFRYTYMQISDFIINTKIDANMKQYAPFAKVGFEKFTTERISYSIALRAGYSWIDFTSNTCPGKPAQQAYYLQPEFALSILSTENLGFSFIVSYSWINAQYGPELLCLPNFSGMIPSDNKGAYQVFSVGFGFTAFFGKERKSTPAFGDR